MSASCELGIWRWELGHMGGRRSSPNSKFPIPNAFSLVELLVVVAIIAILAAMLFPVVTAAKQSAKQTRCSSNLKQLVTAWALYADDNAGRACPSYYVIGSVWYNWDFRIDKSTSPYDCRVGLLGRYTKNGEINQCPSFHGNGWDRVLTGYAYNASYVGGDFFAGIAPCVVAEIARPSRKAIFADAGFPGFPYPNACNYLRAPSDQLFEGGMVHFRHNATANVAYGDGHIGRVANKYHFKPEEPEFGALSEDDSAYCLR
jgi:prepilin-type N-terminal cleavage/methylation domain-containing protein/prepilin-type processing-associated H-X9-DG protein